MPGHVVRRAGKDPDGTRRVTVLQDRKNQLLSNEHSRASIPTFQISRKNYSKNADTSPEKMVFNSGTPQRETLYFQYADPYVIFLIC